MANVREIIETRLKEMGIPLSSASKQIGKNGTYIQQFLRYNTPEKLPEDERIRLAALLGVDEAMLRDPPPPANSRSNGASQRHENVVHPPIQMFSAKPTMPVYASAEGGAGAMIVSTDAIEYVVRPHTLEAVTDAYAILIDGESMIPAYEPGDKAWVNPLLPPMRNMDHIFYDVDNQDKHATIKRLVSWTDKDWVVKQYNPLKEFKLPRSTWAKCHRVVGKFNK